MELALREEVQEFIRACDTLARIAQQHDGLTEEEQEIVMVNFVRALEREIVPSHPLVSQRAPDRLTSYQRTSTIPSAP